MKGRINLKKFKIFSNVLNEEKWLNEQLEAGYKCINISGYGSYSFEPADKKHVIRLDYQGYLSSEKFNEYKAIYEDFGWVHVKGSRLSGLHYWQKENDGQTEIFSDNQSLSNYYKRLMNYASSTAVLFLVFIFTLYNENSIQINSIYLTPGLWGMEGKAFWFAFLFETPFAIFRIIPPFLFVACAIIYINSYISYKRIKKLL